MDVDAILGVHESQDGRASLAANIVRRMLADFERIDAQEFLPTKAVSLKQARRTEAEGALADELRRLRRPRRPAGGGRRRGAGGVGAAAAARGARSGDRRGPGRPGDESGGDQRRARRGRERGHCGIAPRVELREAAAGGA